MNWKYITNVEDAPKHPHFAIIEFTQVTIPGDERSRTHPGHGYPESIERFTKYYVYTDEKEWLKDIEYRIKEKSCNFFAIKANPVKIEVETKVSIKISD